VFRLSPNNNIGESYKKFGLSDTTTNLIAVKLPLMTSSSDKWVVDQGITNQSVSQHLGSVVEGTSVEIGEEGVELGQGCDVEKVRKVYKLSAESGAKKGKKGVAVNGDGDAEKHARRDMESVILGTIALKGS
jgi:EKC/KEOPS complex subunit CGI121/TPRKB